MDQELVLEGKVYFFNVSFFLIIENSVVTVNSVSGECG